MVDLGDREDLLAWLRALEEACADWERASNDLLRPLRKRELGPVSAGAIIAESADKIAKLIAAARGSTGYADPSGLGGSNDVN